MNKFINTVFGLTKLTGVEIILDLFLLELELFHAAQLCMATSQTTVMQ